VANYAELNSKLCIKTFTNNIKLHRNHAPTNEVPGNLSIVAPPSVYYNFIFVWLLSSSAP
jgi:hypothetical protein